MYGSGLMEGIPGGVLDFMKYFYYSDSSGKDPYMQSKTRSEK